MLQNGWHPTMPVNHRLPLIASYKEPWNLGAFFEHFYRFSLDLASTGASAALARTATAPLERAKVSILPLMLVHSLFQYV